MKNKLLIATVSIAAILSACNQSSNEIEVVEIEDTKPLSATEHPYPEMEAAAEAGNPVAQYNMGVLYDLGNEIIENDEKAIEWYKKAALQGYPEAHMSLADMFENGEGVEKDLSKAILGYQVAATSGIVQAQMKLGSFYELGRGLDQDESKSLYWFKLAARQGEADAQARVGAKYGNGQGTDENFVLAYVWSSLGAENGGTDAAGNKLRIKEKMTKEQIAQAELLIEQCRLSEFQNCETLDKN